METLDIKIELPSTVTVHIPSFSNISMESVMKTLATNGVQLIKDTIERRVLEEFVKRHEKYIQDEVTRLLDEKSDEITKLLNS